MSYFRAQLLRFLRLGLFGLGASLVVLLIIPKPHLLEDVPFSPAYVDRQGQLLRLNLATDDRYRIFVPLDKISPRLVEMTLLHEDRYFHAHPGFNPLALFRALNFDAATGRPRLGASTISMQVVRLHYGLNTRTPWGKFVQILAALHLELHCSKREILEAYLNLASYGGNIEGVGAASRIYFGKAPDDLSTPEALTLAVIPQSPARRAPGRHRGDDALLRARKILLAQWLDHHPEDAHLLSVMDMPLQVKQRRELPFRAPHLVDQLMEETPEPRAETQLTLDGATQDLVENRMRDYIATHENKGLRNGCALLIDTTDNSVVAAVGSVDYRAKVIQGQVNGLHMQRSPGSALKPFIYALALDQGLIHPHTLLKDAPTNFGGYDPENFDRTFLGPISATDALTQSRNIPAVDLESRLHAGDNLYALLQKIGVRRLQPETKYGLTIALGSAEVSPEEMASLYAAVAHRGVWRPLHYRTEDQPPAEGLRLFSPEASWLLLDMLASAPRPDAMLAGGVKTDAQTDAPVAWKTGTSFSFRDAWSAAVFDHYALVVWIGNFDGKTNPAFVGRTAAAPLLFSIIDALRARPQTEFGATANPFTRTPNLNLREVDLCADSGALASPNCPHVMRGWFIPGKSPITVCEIHRRIWVDNQTGRRYPGYPPHPESAHQETVEFWPSDLSKLFAAAGLARKAPPPLVGTTGTSSATADNNHGPRIVSPKAGLIYHIRLSVQSDEIMSLEASAETSQDEVRWFVDATYIGSSRASTPLLWHPEAGKHVIRVVDEQGRADARTVTITTVE